jgi:hypothetical protein
LRATSVFQCRSAAHSRRQTLRLRQCGSCCHERVEQGPSGAPLSAVAAVVATTVVRVVVVLVVVAHHFLPPFQKAGGKQQHLQHQQQRSLPLRVGLSSPLLMVGCCCCCWAAVAVVAVAVCVLASVMAAEHGLCSAEMPICVSHRAGRVQRRGRWHHCHRCRYCCCCYYRHCRECCM